MIVGVVSADVVDDLISIRTQSRETHILNDPARESFGVHLYTQRTALFIDSDIVLEQMKLGHGAGN